MSRREEHNRYLWACRAYGQWGRWPTSRAVRGNAPGFEGMPLQPKEPPQDLDVVSPDMLLKANEYLGKHGWTIMRCGDPPKLRVVRTI